MPNRPEPVGAADSPALAGLIAAFHARTPPRSWSLIVTLFGDFALPRGEAIRLSDLIGWMEPLGIEPGLVRTALSRLVGNGTLKRHREGRAAFYRLSSEAERDFSEAAALIYGRRLPRPTGSFDILLIEEAGARGDTRRRLAQEGFVPLAANLMLRPCHADREAPGEPGCLVLALHDTSGLASRARALWPIDALAAGYRAVAAHALAIETEANADTQTCFLMRLMLVHEYRRIILRDPFLPTGLLPGDWPGPAAREAFNRALAQLERRAETTLG